ncbi:MAG TPA: hypothetical protein VJ771_07095 [Candidatus Nitrosotalea sp.]|nr:hypothetical protein [Candidatus Nitrosotalea sp.]
MSRIKSTSDLEKKIMKLTDEHLDALRIYAEFKRLREQIGKPLKENPDPEQMIKDLRGEGFAPLGRRKVDQKGTRKTRHFITSRIS